MRIPRLAIVTAMMLSLTLQSFEASARVGSRSSSISSSRSMSAPSSAPQRVGGGGNAGMQRPDVMNQARSAQPAPQPGVAPQPAAGGLATQAQQPRQGFGVGSMVGAAAAGAAVGYLANSAMHDGYNNQAQAPAGANGSYGSPLAPEQPRESRSPWGFILMLLAGTAAVMGVLMMLSRRREAAERAAASGYMQRASNTAAPVATAAQDSEKQEFERNALKFFNDLQEANNRGDIAHMKQNVTEPLRDQLIADIQERNAPSRTQTMMMKAERIDLTEEAARSIASVRFRGMISEDTNAAPEQIDEVWHFVRDRDAGSQWQLAGIEQI